MVELLFKILLGKAAGVSIAALLFFSAPVIQLEGNSILVNGFLQGIITEKAARILKSGAPISIEFDFSLTLHGATFNKLYNKKIVHSIGFDPLAQTYVVNRPGARDTVKTLQKAIDLLGHYYVTMDMVATEDGVTADFYGEAHLDYTSSLQIDIPASSLWEYYIPTVKLKNLSLEKK
jgi:hypothetical protein